MDLIAIIVGIVGVVGSIASIVGLFRSGLTNRQRVVHAAWGISVALCVGAAVWSQQKLSRIERVERAATELLKDRRFNYTPEGFIQAALAFLEKNKDLHPDSYARAQEICRLNNCLGSQHSGGSENSLNHAFNQINVASALEGLLRGIATINKDS